MSTVPRYFDRDLSWLAFNARVLQETADSTVPLFERLAFLAIFSSNLDEFFRVRVAALRSRLEVGEANGADAHLSKKLWQIKEVVTEQQEAFGRIFRGQILPALEAADISLVDESDRTPAQAAFLHAYFAAQVRPLLAPVFLQEEGRAAFLKNQQLYLVVECWPRDAAAGTADYALVQVPSPPLSRFVALPGEDRRQVMFLDDVIRMHLPLLFPEHEVGSAYAVKLSRDAELYLGDEWEGDLVEKVRASLARRETGAPCRFLYDQAMPFPLAVYLQHRLGLAEEDMIPGARYHNFNDFLSFPRFGRERLSNKPLPPLMLPELEQHASLFAAAAERDRVLHFPYQSFTYVPRFLQEAAEDPAVEEVWITLYRVARDSSITQALIDAAARGKRVTAFVEVKARFDEAPNLRWAERMQAAGVRVLYSLPDLKVHAKLALVVRREAHGRRGYAYLGTGNFNEKTARIYTDHGLLTADARLTEEVHRIFHFLAGEVDAPAFTHLLVAPHAMRAGFYRLIDREIAHARAGRPARMILKMNSLEDEEIIARLYEAASAGVAVQLIVRGICRLVPGAAGSGENIRVRSIIDRFLEHARVYIFHNGGDERFFLASADWMRRNLDRRIEVAFPVYDEAVRQELRAIIELQLADNTKARIIDREQRNAYAPGEGVHPVRAQVDAYRLLKSRVVETTAP